jgi:E3 ubiquitin-protein ligase HUWE1
MPFAAAYHTHRSRNRPREPETGTNPLLVDPSDEHPPPPGGRFRDPIGWTQEHFHDPTARELQESPLGFINNIMNMITSGRASANFMPGEGATIRVQVGGAPGLFPPGMIMPPHFHVNHHRSHGRYTHPAQRVTRDDPSSVVQLETASTPARWMEEGRILFGPKLMDRTNVLVTAIHRCLIPPARQREKEDREERQKREEEEAAAKAAKDEAERKEREEREAKEKQEREEREAAEAVEAAARAQAEAEHAASLEAEVSDPMTGVEEAQASETDDEEEEPETEGTGADESTERQMVNFRGRDIDITDLGIDMSYLDALPSDLREDVILNQLVQHRAQAAATGTEPTELDQTFLDALPPEIRNEIIREEQHARRRQGLEDQRLREASAGPGNPEDIDPASFFAALDPVLRRSLLQEVDEELLSQLPPEMASEARALGGGHRIFTDSARRNAVDRSPRVVAEASPKRKPHTYAQILDKAGVATLLRLIFIPQQGSAKTSLDDILRHVCQNKQNRAEVVSILLSILQDGSNDIVSVERSFAHLTLRAKQPSGGPKTPQLKRTPTEPFSSSDMSPLMVVQQCLSTLTVLTNSNRKIIDFFLTEHETNSFRSRSARKGKAKETKSSRYPINALLGLLDRKLVIESTPIMEQLATLLQLLTRPLSDLINKDKDKDKPSEDKTAEASGPVAEATEDGETSELPVANAPTEVPAAIEPSANQAGASSEPAPENAIVEATEDKTKKRGLTTPPDVSVHNLRLVVNIFAARECSGKTFKNTLTVITNLSVIPEAKKIFGQELIRQAEELGRSILEDLHGLVSQIRKATSGNDVQGLALSRFSPASSDQAKLLRVITALDFLYDPKRKELFDAGSTDSSGVEDAILTSLYENDTFSPIWNSLSDCLTAIKTRGNMFSVATILLPLIEVLMIVCKNTTLKENVPQKNQRELQMSSPPPETNMENLFFRFTDDHRKILNELVRHNPKLMSASFSILVRNSKVLEFDNKRNFFNRRLHNRSTHDSARSHGSLALSIRRAYVFLDSYKSLYYKKPDELKYGKLSIRFNSEEGIDAGGVTREWFQALSRQMFDPQYALFINVASDSTTFHPNPLSGVNSEHLSFFKFIGRIIGKAMYEGRVLDCHFSRAVYKRMLGKSVSIKDMESLDPDYYRSLVWMLENDITDVITESFSIQQDNFGEIQILDLIPNGHNIPVSEENKHEYVQLVIEHKMIGSVKEQLQHFLDGKLKLSLQYQGKF